MYVQITCMTTWFQLPIWCHNSGNLSSRGEQADWLQQLCVPVPVWRGQAAAAGCLHRAFPLSSCSTSPRQRVRTLSPSGRSVASPVRFCKTRAPYVRRKILSGAVCRSQLTRRKRHGCRSRGCSQWVLACAPWSDEVQTPEPYKCFRSFDFR